MGEIRVTKSAAKKLIEDGYTIKMMPCNINLKNIWIQPTYVSKETLAKLDTDFDKFDNEYCYYNCTNAQTGYHPRYYMETGTIPVRHNSPALGYKQATAKYKEAKTNAKIL